jgi:hypothetical protein
MDAIAMMRSQDIDEEKDISRRIVKNFLLFLEDPMLFDIHQYCFNCKTEVSFRVQHFKNTIVDEVAHCYREIDSGGEIDPAICGYCGVLNIFTSGTECAPVQGYRPVPVAGVVFDDWTPMRQQGNGLILDHVQLPSLPIENLVKYKQRNKNRPPITRVEWVDYFKSDPAVVLSRFRGNMDRDGQNILY